MSLDYHTIPTIIHVVSAIHFHCYHNNVPIELTLDKDRPCLTIIAHNETPYNENDSIFHYCH